MKIPNLYYFLLQIIKEDILVFAVFNVLVIFILTVEVSGHLNVWSMLNKYLLLYENSLLLKIYIFVRK